jgi:hypothetical protein
MPSMKESAYRPHRYWTRQRILKHCRRLRARGLNPAYWRAQYVIEFCFEPGHLIALHSGPSPVIYKREVVYGPLGESPVSQ